jgi:hypothetical protein
VLESIKTSGDIQDVDAFEAALKGFGEQFQATGSTDEPAPAAVVAADAVLAEAEADDVEAAAE